MLKNENIICISSIDWDFIWQGHQEIMSSLAAAGNTVLFIENTGVRMPTLRDLPRIRKRLLDWSKGIGGIRKQGERLYIFSPLVVPFPYLRLARWVNKHLLLYNLNKWMRATGFNNPIIWAFLPTGLTLDLVNNIDRKALIYYCIDNFAASSSLAQKVRRTEQRLIKQSNMVFVTARQLSDYCSRYNQRVWTFPFGVNIEGFEKVAAGGQIEVPPDLKDIKRPIIGYVGGLHKWVDQNLVRSLAERLGDYSFVFVGPLQVDVSNLAGIKNIHFLGAKAHQQLPHYISHFNAGIIPYLLTEYTKNVYPTKLNEYLALGKSVISTDLQEINAFNQRYGNIVSIGRDYMDFAECIRQAVTAEADEQTIRRRREIARENSWPMRIEQMSRLIEEDIQARQKDRYLKWKEDLLDFYRIARRRLLKTAGICLLTYFLLLRTPLFWLLASPLKISQAPQPADVIVVLGGGVGESGSPGKSTIERARYAAELYAGGYAGKVIFSSGYSYNYNDAENMKLIAVSAGVPQRNIILEQEADSTFENAAFTSRILQANNWDSMLLVSSPYNMRRAALSFNKADRALKIIYTPVPNSQFYVRDKRVRWAQIKAIAHEYLGIIYYWWKGYI